MKEIGRSARMEGSVRIVPPLAGAPVASQRCRILRPDGKSIGPAPKPKTSCHLPGRGAKIKSVTHVLNQNRYLCLD
jgi:hypothetical protein